MSGSSRSRARCIRELERRFSPEFRNRIDEVVLFAPLSHDEVREIAKHYLAQVTLTLAKAGKTITVEDEALELLVVQGYNIGFGARFLKRVIDQKIKLPISERWKEGSNFVVKAKDGEIIVESAPAQVVTPAGILEFGDVV